MRRKGLLGLVLLISAVIGFASYCIYDQSHHIPDYAYITIANWGEDTQATTAYVDDIPEVAIPLTGRESSETFISVMSPRDLVLLPEHHADVVGPTEIVLALDSPLLEDSEGSDASEDLSLNSIIVSDTNDAEAIDVPALGEDTTNTNSSAPESTHASHNLLRFISGFIILSFFSYLTYQHFRR